MKNDVDNVLCSFREGKVNSFTEEKNWTLLWIVLERMRGERNSIGKNLKLRKLSSVQKGASYLIR